MPSPCLCGDPSCPACGGDPSLAKKEAITDQFYELISNESVSIAESCLINTKHFIASLKEFSPCIIRDVKESIAEVVREKSFELEEKAREMEED